MSKLGRNRGVVVGMAVAAGMAWGGWEAQTAGGSKGSSGGGADANAPVPCVTTAPATTKPAATRPASTQPAKVESFAAPCPTTSPARPGGEDLQRFATGSPFDKDYKPPAIKEGKRMWAKSFLWTEAPPLVVEKWLTRQPETKGKYMLIEFWATWCPPCRKSIHLLNRFHEKYGKELVVIGISDEAEAAVRKLKEPAIRYYSAIDTKARMKSQVGVWGIPHVILVEPGGYVIWEGFPLLKDYELKEETIEKILAIGRKTGALMGK